MTLSLDYDIATLYEERERKLQINEKNGCIFVANT